MTEVSHAEVDPRSMDHLRGRAIHIHDEMVYADASAFYGMNAMWDNHSHADHFAGRGGEKPDAYLTEDDTIVLAHCEKQSVLITGMGYAMGHYARWLTRGAMRLDAVSDDRLVQVTAWRDDAAKRLVLVVVNNAPQERTLDIAASGFKPVGDIVGEQSFGDVRWRKRSGDSVDPAGRIRATVQPLSVSTLAVPIAVDLSSSGGQRM